jgi:uncharacterized protein YndB with AHSA1/START domain
MKAVVIWTARAGIVFALVFLTVYLVGSGLPTEYAFARRVHTKQAPEAVYDMVTDYTANASWVPGLINMEPLPPRDGRETWKVTDERKLSMLMIVERAERPKHLVRRYIDSEGSFNETWEMELVPAQNGTDITMIERGGYRNPFFRFLGHYILGQDKFVNDYLKSLSRKLGEEANIQELPVT